MSKERKTDSIREHAGTIRELADLIDTETKNEPLARADIGDRLASERVYGDKKTQECLGHERDKRELVREKDRVKQDLETEKKWRDHHKTVSENLGISLKTRTRENKELEKELAIEKKSRDYWRGKRNLLKDDNEKLIEENKELVKENNQADSWNETLEERLAYSRKTNKTLTETNEKLERARESNSLIHELKGARASAQYWLEEKERVAKENENLLQTIKELGNSLETKKAKLDSIYIIAKPRN